VCGLPIIPIEIDYRTTFRKTFKDFGETIKSGIRLEDYEGVINFIAVLFNLFNGSGKKRWAR
jgi:hypothetical protein